MDVHTFLSHYQSFPTVLQQEQFLYKTYPRTYSLDQTRESHLIDHLLSVDDVKEKSHVRLQLLGVKLLVIYRDTDRLFELLVNHKAYSPDVYLLAIMTGCRLLSDEQVKSLLFPTSESGSDLIKQYGSPVFLNALVKAVSRNKRSVIDRDLLMRVASNDSFSNNNVLVLLSGVLPNGEQSDNLIVDILVNVLHEHDLKIYKNLLKNHPEALLKFLRVLQQREHSLLTDSARQSYETYVEPMVRIVGPNWRIITAIASTNKDLNLKVIQLLREWFVDPLEQIHSHTGMCSILRLRFSTFAKNKDAFLDLLVDGRANKGLIAKRYELQNEFSHLVKEYSVQQLTRLFELFVDADFNLPVKQSELALWLLTSMPTSKSRDLYKVEEFQRHLWQKYGEKLENWLVKHVEIDQLCYLIPELGSIIADKRFQVDQVTVPGLTLFHNKCTYLKYMKASVSDDERLTEFMNNCSDPNPEVRAIVLSSLLLASFYHSINQKKIVQFVVQQMKNEHNEFMEIFERRIRPDYYMHKEGNTLYSLIRAHMVQDDELLALWQSLISLIARRTQNFQEIVWVIASAYRGSEEKDKLTRWAFDVAKSCSPTQIADFLVGQHFRFDSRGAPILWNLECLSNLMLDYFKEQVSRGKFDEMGSFFKQTNPLLHSKQLSGLYKNVFIPALLALPIITDENNIRELQYLVDKIHLFCSQNEVDEIFYRLIERDPSFIFCLSVQRWVLSKRTSIALLEKYLSLNENSTMSYAELHDLKKDANHILANQSGCIYCLNPHLMREQRIERYLSEDTMNKITRMLIFSDRILMKSNATLSSNSFVPSHLTLHAHSHMPPRLAQKRIVQFAGRMQVEKQEALFFRNLVNEIILTLPDDGVIVKDDVLGIVRMSKYLTAHCPEELLQDILNDMTSEYALYYYDALMRCSSFIPVQQWIQQLSDFITQKQADYEKGISSPNWGITPQKILFSWFKKLWFFKTGFNASQLIEMFIHLFHNDKTHRDTKRVIIEVLLSYVASIVDSESKEAQKVLSIVIGSLDHEYAEIPRAVMRQVYRLSFKSREIHDSLLFSVSQLLSHEDPNICLEAWTTTSESLAPRNNGTSMLSKKAMELIVNQCVKQYLLFDHELRQELISLVTSTMVNVASGDQSAVKEKFVNGLTALISNPQYIELDLEFDNEHGFDRPRFERLKKICDQLSTEIRQRDNVSALHSVFVQPLIDLMLKYEPLLYSDRGVGLTLIVARTADELFDTLSQIVHNLCSLTNESLQRVCAQNALNSVIYLISSIGRGVRSTERQVVSPSDYEQLVRNVEKKYEQLSSSDSNSLEYELWTGILYIVLHSGLEKMLSAWEDCSLISMIRRQNQTHPLVGYVCATMSGIHREGPNRDRRGRGRLRGRGLRRGLPRY